MDYNWQDYFMHDYLPDHDGYFTPERLSQEIDFLTKNVLPTKSSAILDLACGQGRHSIALTQQGYTVLGVDRDEQLLTMADQAARTAKTNVTFVQQDMRTLHLDQTFDVILLMFCTFGVENDETNKETLKVLKKHLKPGGRIFFDIHNLFRFARRMRTNETNHAVLNLQTLSLWDKVDDELVLPLRLYTIPEMTERLAVIGLTPIKTWGDYDESHYTFDSERLLLLAEER